MPFKSDVNTLNKSVADIEQHKQQPLSAEGLNSSNLGGFQLDAKATAPAEQQHRMVDANRSLVTTQQNTAQTMQKQGTTVNTYGLVMPSVEYIPKPSSEMTDLDRQIAQLVVAKIWDCVVYNRFYHFFTVPRSDETSAETRKTPQQRLQDVANRATLHDYQILMELFKIPNIDQATDLCVLALFDVIVLMDDSSSMLGTGRADWQGQGLMDQYGRLLYDKQGKTMSVDYDESEGAFNDRTRWDLAEALFTLTSFVLTMFDDDGIAIRFLNKNYRSLAAGLCDGVKSVDKVREIFKAVKPSGGTAIGASLENIYNEFVAAPLTSGRLCKPVLVITYTDGESNDSITASIRKIRSFTRRTPYGSRAVLFSFNQVGRDGNAREALGNLDNDRVDVNGRDFDPNGTVAEDFDAGAGTITDCTSAYADEIVEYNARQAKLNPEMRVPYSVAFHNIKGLIGPAVEKYDASDESNQASMTATQRMSSAASSVGGFFKGFL